MSKLICAMSTCVLLVACAPAPHTLSSTNTDEVINGKTIEMRDSRSSKAVVALLYENASGNMYTFCSATLVAQDAIVLAGHCFDSKLMGQPARMEVDYGETIYTTHFRVPVKAFERNQHYNEQGIYDHDIAVAVLAEPVPSEMQPAAIDTNTSANYSNRTVTVYGYGRSRDYNPTVLHQDMWESTGFLHSGEMRIDGDYNETPDRYFTTGTTRNSICQGDSGGPNFMTLQGRLTLVGVNSASPGAVLQNGLRSCTGRSQLTKVAPFAGWIKETIAKLRAE